MRAYTKDVLRTVRGEKKRLLALMTISALGVTMMTGLKASCDDLRHSADALFDAQTLHDISVVSTLGLKDADADALTALESIEKAQGCFSKNVQIELNDGFTEAKFSTFTAGGIDEPYVLEGKLPEKAGEAAVTLSYLKASGKKIGDSFKITEELEEAEEEQEEIEGLEELSEEEKPSFPNTEYTITGIVTDVTAVVNPDGATAFRSTGTEDYTAFVTWDSVETDYYTSVELTVKGAKELEAFSPEYEMLIQSAKDDIETLVKENRQREGYKAIRSEAEEKLTDAEEKVNEKFDEAQKELDDAADEIEDAKREIEDARKELRDGQIELDKGQAELEMGILTAKNKANTGRQQLAEERQKLNEGLIQLNAYSAQLDIQEAEINGNEAVLNEAKTQAENAYAQLEGAKQQLQSAQDAAYSQLNDYEAQAVNAINALQSAITGLDPQSEGYEAELAELTSQLAAAQAGLAEVQANRAAAEAEFNAQWAQINEQSSQLEQGMAEINTGLAALADGRIQIEAARQEISGRLEEARQGAAMLDEAEIQLINGEKQGEEELMRAIKELEDGKKELEDGRKELEDGIKELEDGEREYADALIEFSDKRSEADKKLGDARSEIEDIPECIWYVRDRKALNGFADIKSDADCIESIGTIFPIMFLVVAVLISLTTINRMVDENRGLIGTYQALGFRDTEIRRKYILYAATASIAGGILGNIFGFIVLPKIIIIIFRQMYLISEYTLSYDIISGAGGTAVFFAAIVGTTLVSCGATVKKMPAVLMRPKTPKAGSRILLERIKPVWKRMSFLNKVTARNLFRYKKRFLMTVFGIAGCTGLLLCGFSIKDTVADLLPRQYEQIISYDIMAVTAGDEDFESLLDFADTQTDSISEKNELAITNVDVHNEKGETLSVQLYVFPINADISPYFTLTDLDGNKIELPDEGCCITENISSFMGFEKSDSMAIQDTALNEAETEIKDIAEFYLGNCILMSEKEYEKHFEEYSPNALLIRMSETGDEAELTASLNRMDEVLSVSSVGDLKAGFNKSFMLMNMVVYVVIVLAGALAFAVLFTLAATNISERDREIATIKVLGFFDGEVHTYVNKETMILTVIGIIAGLPLGVYLGDLLGRALQMPSIVFRTVVHPLSYVLSGGITLVFALIVNTITNKMIDSIDPVEALKSVE